MGTAEIGYIASDFTSPWLWGYQRYLATIVPFAALAGDEGLRVEDIESGTN